MYGALNLYSTIRHGFSDDDTKLAKGSPSRPQSWSPTWSPIGRRSI